MARRALAAVALLALGLAGAASAGLLAGTRDATSCAGSTDGTTAASTTVGPSGTTTVTPLGGASTVAPPGCLGGTASTPSATAPPTVTTNGAASTLVITGHGWGHGMGMGQWGAYGYALHGWSYRQILAHYYRGTTVAAGPSPTVRVLLEDGLRRVTLDSASPWHVVDARRTRIDLPAGKLVLPASLEVSGRRLVSPLTFAPGSSPLEVGTSAYRGKLLVSSNGKSLQVVNAVGLEAYVQGVVGAEVPETWPQGALEAQAVAARSYALAQLATVVTASPFDLYADSRSQVYGGISAESPTVVQAVSATARQVVLYDGKVAMTYFSSSTGGETVSAKEALGTPIPYLVSVPDPYDTLSPNHDWGPVLVSAQAAGKALGLGGPVVDLSLVPGASGHLAQVTASDGDAHRTLAGSQVAAALGLRSDWFAVAWLTLAPPSQPAAVGASVTLTGSVRGLTGVTLETRPKGGVWGPAGAVKPGVGGTFTIRVVPAGTTQYRLAAGTVRGALVTVRVA